MKKTVVLQWYGGATYITRAISVRCPLHYGGVVVVLVLVRFRMKNSVRQKTKKFGKILWAFYLVFLKMRDQMVTERAMWRNKKKKQNQIEKNGRKQHIVERMNNRMKDYISMWERNDEKSVAFKCWCEMLLQFHIVRSTDLLLLHRWRTETRSCHFNAITRCVLRFSFWLSEMRLLWLLKMAMKIIAHECDGLRFKIITHLPLCDVPLYIYLIFTHKHTHARARSLAHMYIKTRCGSKFTFHYFAIANVT